MGVHFEWDSRKAYANIRKHGVSFDEACTVFDDTLAVVFEDEDHSVDEKREIIIGHSIRNRLLLVCFTERERAVIRIFSARSANRREQKDHAEGINR
jgi:uncharacterized DUF497 family protein